MIRKLVISGVIILLTATSPFLVSSEIEQLEYKIKAGYLYNFTKFINWPTLNGKTFNFCYFSNDAFSEIIKPIEKKRAFSRPILAVRLDEAALLNSTQLIPNCQLLYLQDELINLVLLQKALSYFSAHGTLLVGETETFLANGGMIRFAQKAGKIKLQINLALINKSSLTISAKLLEIAELIKNDVEHD
jgi:hypothetical protein